MVRFMFGAKQQQHRPNFVGAEAQQADVVARNLHHWSFRSKQRVRELPCTITALRVRTPNPVAAAAAEVDRRLYESDEVGYGSRACARSCPSYSSF